MPGNDRDLIKVLNDLAATARDSEEGFGKAAKGVHSDALRELFVLISAQRAHFASELEAGVRALGGAPSGSGHFGAILHPRLGGPGDAPPAEGRTRHPGEAERGEELALGHFTHALAEDLPPDIHQRVETQLQEVRNTLERLRRLERTRTAG